MVPPVTAVGLFPCCRLKQVGRSLTPGGQASHSWRTGFAVCLQLARVKNSFATETTQWPNVSSWIRDESRSRSRSCDAQAQYLLLRDICLTSYPSVCHDTVLCQNRLTYCHNYLIARPNSLVFFHNYEGITKFHCDLRALNTAGVYKCEH